MLKNIDWKSRLSNKTFVVSFMFAILLLVNQILGLFGIEWDYMVLGVQLEAIIGTVFLIAILLGVVQDPTTPGTGDTESLDRANYILPEGYEIIESGQEYTDNEQKNMN